MAGAYTLSRDGHVRGDVIYRLWPQRVQAMIDFTLFLLFFFPGVSALIYSGFIFARQSWRYGETSVYSPAEIPIYPAQGADPGRRRGPVSAGHLRARPLHPLHAGRLLAGRAITTSRSSKSAILHHHEDELAQLTKRRRGDASMTDPEIGVTMLLIFHLHHHARVSDRRSR